MVKSILQLELRNKIRDMLIREGKSEQNLEEVGLSKAKQERGRKDISYAMVWR